MKVLVVDDARMMRRVISDVVTDSGHEVVGEAPDGEQALDLVRKLHPDLITLDIEMPGMSGLKVLEHVMKYRPTKVLLVSAHTTAAADVTLEGLALGAIDFVPKPSELTGLDGFTLALGEALKAATFARLRSTPGPAKRETTPRQSTTIRRPSLIVVASSTGGPDALTRFFGGFRVAPPAPVLVVQHMPAHFTGRLAARLDGLFGFHVAEATDGEIPRPGRVLVAPGDRHLGYQHGQVRLLDTPPVGRLRPAADVTLEEVAGEIGSRTLVTVLSGMGKDGLAGAELIAQAGGQVIAQDEQTSAVDGMPRAVREAGLTVLHGSPEHLAGAIDSTMKRGAA